MCVAAPGVVAPQKKAATPKPSGKNEVVRAEALFKRAELLEKNNQFEEAVSEYQAAYAIDHQLRPDRAARDLNAMALNLRYLGRVPEAISRYRQALSEVRAGDPEIRGLIQYNLGLTYDAQGNYGPGMAALEEALNDWKHDPPGQVQVLLGLGRLEENHGGFREAVAYYNKAVGIMQRPELRKQFETSEHLALAWAGLARINLELYNNDEVVRDIAVVTNILRTNSSTLALARVCDVRGMLLQRLGKSELESGNIAEARGKLAAGEWEFDLAAKAFRKIHDLAGEAAVLNNSAQGHDSMGRCDLSEHKGSEAIGEFNQAFPKYNQALAIFHQISNPLGEAGVLGNMGTNRAFLVQTGDKAALGQGEKYYLDSLHLYRKIGDAAGPPQVLGDLMRFHVLTKDFDGAIVFGKASVNAIREIRFNIRQLDKSAQRSYLQNNRENYEMLAALYCVKGKYDEAEQVLRLLRLEDALEFAQHDLSLSQNLSEILSPLRYDPSEIPLLPGCEPRGVGTNVEESNRWHDALAGSDGKTALVSTFNIPEGYWVVLTTPTSRQSFKVAIDLPKFNHLCRALHNGLTSSSANPLEAAHDLYDVVFCHGELEKALEDQGIQRVLWFPSGELRNIPIDALHDGTSYLIEKPRQNIYVTLKSRMYFGALEPGKMIAAGVSHGHTVKLGPAEEAIPFPSLGHVSEEVQSVVHDPVHGGMGPWPGQILLDRDFTASKLETALQGARIVHLATHFRLKSGSEAESFLLMGDGSTLSLSHWKEKLRLQDVNLLTLSACETGANGDASTKGEVSSIGEISQWLGAKSVLATQWPAADESTAILMEDFYRRWHANPGAGKVVALRGAQLDMLHGTIKLSLKSLRERGVALSVSEKDKERLGVKNSNPFFWAGFILIGNWR